MNSKKKRKRNSILASKKGNLFFEVLTIVIVLLVFVIAMFIGRWLTTDLNDDMQQDLKSEEAKKIMQDLDDDYSALFDGAFILLFVLLWCLMIVAAFVIDTHPIFAIFTMILMIFMFVIAAYLGNVYEDFVRDDDMAELIPEFPKAHYIMSHLLMVVIVVAFTLLISLFAKNKFMT